MGVTPLHLQNPSVMFRLISKSRDNDRGSSVIMGPCSNLSVNVLATPPKSFGTHLPAIDSF